jgi:hypothetical protein
MDDVETYLRVREIRQWSEETKDREQWRLVEEAKVHLGLWR